MTCSNCSNPAQHVYEPGGNVQIAYCTLHVPKFLKAQQRAGLLKAVSPKKKATKASEPVVEEATSEAEAPSEES